MPHAVTGWQWKTFHFKSFDEWLDDYKGKSKSNSVLYADDWVMNTPAMLILTVFTIPHIQQAANFPWLYLALAFAVVYFGVLVGVLTRLVARSKPRPT